MKTICALPGIIAIAVLAGCSSLGSGDTTAASSPTAWPDCKSNSCVAAEMNLSLPGAIAKDNAVITKAACVASTVKYSSAGNTYTAKCTTRYSDGSAATGFANLVVDQKQVTFEPTGP